MKLRIRLKKPDGERLLHTAAGVLAIAAGVLPGVPGHLVAALSAALEALADAVAVASVGGRDVTWDEVEAILQAVRDHLSEVADGA